MIEVTIKMFRWQKFGKLIQRVALLFTLVFSLISARDWTIMVYMCGDNGMSPQVYEDLTEMTAVGSTPQVAVIVQVDNLPPDPNPSTRRYRIEQDSLKLIADLGEKNMADLAVALDFIRYCKSSYPANKYCLILWDHGSGWFPMPKQSQDLVGPQRSIIYDETDGDSIGVTNGELNRLLTEVRRILGKKLSLLVMDACLMGGIEVAYEVKDGVEVLVASEALVPLGGLPYSAVLTAVVTQPELTAKEFGQAIVQVYSDYYEGLADVTLSAIDLTKLDDFSTGLSDLLKYIKPFATDSIFVQARNTVQTFATSFEIRPPRPSDDLIDLKDFLGKTQTIAQGRYQQVLQKYDSLVISARSTQTFYPNAYGLSIWFPYNYWSFKNQKRYAFYQNLGFADTTGWLEFLNQYYQSDDIKPPMTEVRFSKVGGKNNFTIYWDAVYDFAGVKYELTEIAYDTVILFDQAENISYWDTTAFSFSSGCVHSPPYSFFSGNANNLDARLELRNSIAIPNGGLLSFYCYYNTEENFINSQFKRDILYLEVTQDSQWHKIDSVYGSVTGWTEFRYFLPNYPSCRIRFHFTSDSSIISEGIYIDDIRIFRLGQKRTIIADYPETSFTIYNLPKAIYKYAVTPIDGFGNKGNVSQFSQITISSYAEPFAKPNPFFSETGCYIYLDYPSTEEPTVYIYTLSGELVKKFEFSAIGNKEIYWNGKNSKDREVGSGIYLVLVKGKNFSRLGKIAKVK
ncbi:MAG: clostripain-related cysteine peptidase [candidate division WOR-3 bacterium]